MLCAASGRVRSAGCVRHRPERCRCTSGLRQTEAIQPLDHLGQMWGAGAADRPSAARCTDRWRRICCSAGRAGRQSASSSCAHPGVCEAYRLRAGFRLQVQEVVRWCWSASKMLRKSVAPAGSSSASFVLCQLVQGRPRRPAALHLPSRYPRRHQSKPGRRNCRSEGCSEAAGVSELSLRRPLPVCLWAAASALGFNAGTGSRVGSSSGGGFAGAAVGRGARAQHLIRLVQQRLVVVHRGDDFDAVADVGCLERITESGPCSSRTCCSASRMVLAWNRFIFIYPLALCLSA